jgi:hypothetical protein
MSWKVLAISSESKGKGHRFLNVAMRGFAEGNERHQVGVRAKTKTFGVTSESHQKALKAPRAI